VPAAGARSANEWWDALGFAIPDSFGARISLLASYAKDIATLAWICEGAPND